MDEYISDQGVIVVVPTTEKAGFLEAIMEEVIDEVEDFFDFNADSNDEVKTAPVVNSTTTIHTQTVVIKNGLVINETHTVETVNENAPIVTVLYVNATTAAPLAVSPVVLVNTENDESDNKPTPAGASTVYKSNSTTVIRKKSTLPASLFQKMIDILNQSNRVIPQIEVPENSNIVVEKFHYK